ncbi:hypothetical protein AVEN_257265-1 [Araneus ventricosus]|uniref:Uncharacterized protein n=1 Tax=Araneus ventricosus TaxID=182803 RepID=A0A4Y2HBI7_ARAVE|nr:hypothetical protein AVEN_257265-1 [Araneus ventricosus]
MINWGLDHGRVRRIDRRRNGFNPNLLQFERDTCSGSLRFAVFHCSFQLKMDSILYLIQELVGLGRDVDGEESSTIYDLPQFHEELREMWGKRRNRGKGRSRVTRLSIFGDRGMEPEPWIVRAASMHRDETD